MRTRRIAIGCRRNGSVAVAKAGPTDPVSLDLLPVDLTWPPHLDRLPPLDRIRPPLRAELPALPDAIPSPAPPPPGDRDLTLADLTTGRRDLSWNDNPGWPRDVDWTTITRVARGHSPRHARRSLLPMPARLFTWTGAGVLAAVLLTILAVTISELIH